MKKSDIIVFLDWDDLQGVRPAPDIEKPGSSGDNYISTGFNFVSHYLIPAKMMVLTLFWFRGNCSVKLGYFIHFWQE